MKKIKVLIVDDSAVVRQVISALLSNEPDIEVLTPASDPIFAQKKMAVQWPDVMILDVEMPRMDGITFLKQLMAEHPTPVIICSTLTERGAEVTMQALQAGALTIITKPKAGLKDFLQESRQEMLSAVRAAAQAKLENIVKPKPHVLKKVQQTMPNPNHPTLTLKTTQKVVVIGTSTGGTQALEAILTALPAVSPGIVIVQHMPEKFTAMFADRLNGLCQIEVREAKNGDRVLPGLALIAPGGRHMQLNRSGAHYQVEIKDGPAVNRHKPSVDVLFRSAAKHVGPNAVGFILTGMGDDGARGLHELKESGAYTVAQDEASCIVFGMPKEAIERGGACSVLPLNQIAQEILQRASSRHL